MSRDADPLTTVSSLLCRSAASIAAPLLAACASSPRADDAAPAGSPRIRETLALAVENDYFVGKDDNYTNGVALAWIRGPLAAEDRGSLPGRVGRAWPALPFLGSDEHDQFVAFGLGHEIFTPDDLTATDPPVDDQPYAGILYLDLGLARLTPTRSDTWQLRLGVVGPSSQADDLQTAYHDLIGAQEPLGWDTQLPDEPIVNLDYTRAFEWLATTGDDDVGARLVPLASVGAGTYFTGAAAGLFASAGINQPDPVGAISLRRGVGPVLLGGAGQEGRSSLSVFAGVGGFAVAHYLPLDGTVFRASRSVDSEPLVGFASIGGVVRHGRASLTLLVNLFTETFETQRGGDEFASLTFAWRL